LPTGRPLRGAAKAIGATSAERSEPTDGMLGGRPGSTISVRLVAGIVTSTDKVATGGCSLRPIAPTVNLGFDTGARSRSPGGADALSKSHSDDWYVVTSRPTAPLRPSADGRTHGIDQLRGQLAWPEIFRRVRCSSSVWLAVFKMMHRSVGASRLRTTSDGGPAFSSTPRSLTVTGPARTSPRPFGHP
jgi:hypothetical protein